jgi:hypothetical protein
VCSVGVIIVKLAHAIGRVLKSVESRATFGTGVAVPFVARLPASGSRDPTYVSRGAATIGSWPRASHKASAAQTVSATVLWFPAPTASLIKGGTRWSLSAALRPARQRTPCLAAQVAAADRRVCAQAVLPKPSGSHFQTRWFLHLFLSLHRYETVQPPFSYPARRFLHARDRRCLHSLHRCIPVLSTGTAQEVGPLTSSPSSLGQSLGRALWRAAYAPGDG